MELKTFFSTDSKKHVQYIEGYLTDIKKLCHAEIKIVADIKAKVLLETTAEVLSGLEKSFSDYQSENEGAWINDVNRPTRF
jgi:hypothetical protein